MHPLEGAWENVKREFEITCAETKVSARRELTHELNQLLRRFRQYQTEGEWAGTLLDAAAHFAKQGAVFALKDGILQLRGQTNLAVGEDLSIPVSTAAAFASAIESKDPVIALRTPGEVSEALSAENAGERAHILPVTNGERVAGLLFAAGGDEIDGQALELIAGMASMVLERRSNTSLHAQIAAAPMRGEEGSKDRARAAGLPSWAALGEEQRALHVRAQRFSRVSVAQMQLSRPEACRAGREQGNLYVFLKKEIDKARETYRKQFMTIPSMVDYLHLELVHTAAAGDEETLGADYPGALA